MNSCFRPLVVALVVASMVAASRQQAAAQTQSSAQARCIVSLNTAIAKVASRQQRQVSSCVGDVLDGLVLPGALGSCLTSPTSDAVAAILKAEAIDAKSCGQMPDFGYVGAGTAGAVAVNQENALAADIFGDDIGAALATTNADAASCQESVTRFYTRIGAVRAKTFVECKKKGLSLGQIDSAAALDECFDAIDADVKGKIAKTVDKLARAYIKRCIDLADIDALFPGDCTGAQDFLACVDQHSRCRTCLTLNQVDNLAHDCERFDNALLDGSCVDPDADECAGENGGNNCSPNATCSDVENGFTCECNDGYEGDGVTCTDVNECNENLDDCDVNATCTNTVGSFECACKSGWSGDGRTCTDIDECSLNTDNCDVNAACTNTPGGFVCTCNPGWIGTGQACIDRNECALNVDNCSSNASCTNIPGSFTCTCNAGYGGDGVVCTDFNECLGEGGGNNCSVHAQCINVPASFNCQCLSGFSGNGVTCTDIDECTANTDNCSVNATCANTVGSFTCTCNSGYGGNGVTCTDFNECLGQGGGNNCSVNANCTNLPGSFSCACRPGYYGNPVGALCSPIDVNITSPAHGIFTTASSILVTGTVTADPLSDVALTIMAGGGAEVSVPVAGNGTFSTTVPLSASLIFNGIRAKVTQLSTGFTIRDRIVVIDGQSRPMGGLVQQSVGLRINDTGFNDFESVLQGLVDLDIMELLPPETQLFNDCYQDCSPFGCCARARGWVRYLPPYGDAPVGTSLGGYGINVNSQTNYVDGDITLNDLVVDIRVITTIFGVESTCDKFVISAATTNIMGDYTLEPDSGNAEAIDVNQPNDVTVQFSAFNDDIDCGGTGFQTFIIESAIGSTEDKARDALVNFLRDPDGGGPQDAPVAQAIEDALADVELTGPIGEGFGVDLSTPLFAIPEDTAGVTLASGAVMTTLDPEPGAPHFTNTLYIPQTFPFSQLTANVPGTGTPYDMGIVISDSAFNQILAAQVERGLLQADITEIDLFNSGTPEPITAGFLSGVIPEFAQLPPALPLTLRITPTLAPALTGAQGPNGEIAELAISHLLLQVVSGSPGNESLHAEIAADMLSSFDLTVDRGNLVPVLGEPDANDIAITLLTNPLGIDEADIQSLIPQLVGPLVPSLSGLLGSFPLPAFLGLQPTPVAVKRTGDFMGVFMDAVPAP